MILNLKKLISNLIDEYDEDKDKPMPRKAVVSIPSVKESILKIDEGSLKWDKRLIVPIELKDNEQGIHLGHSSMLPKKNYSLCNRKGRNHIMQMERIATHTHHKNYHSIMH